MINKKQLFSYAILSLPLAFVGLPIYVNINGFYAKEYGVNLSLLGVLLLIARGVDMLQGPFVGYLSSYFIHKKISQKRIILYSSILLSISFFGLFNPPISFNKEMICVWFVISLIATYTFFNFAIINYEAIAVFIAKNQKERLAINSAKEFCGLIGILIASILPSVLSNFVASDLKTSYFYSSAIFVVLIFVILIAFFRTLKISKIEHYSRISFRNVFNEIRTNSIFMNYLKIFFINALAVSIPASVIFFYVEDVLRSSSKLGFFLGVYFLAGCIFIGMWKKLAQKHGMINIWIISLIGSVVTFIFNCLLGETTADLFFIVCFASGMFLGADLIIPPAIIANLIYDKKEKVASYIAVWNMVVKLGLVIASSASLIVLGFFDYKIGSYANKGLWAIPYVYSVIPSLLKIYIIVKLRKLRKIKDF
jgi:Na+/melibiose symporter-like transporter